MKNFRILTALAGLLGAAGALHAQSNAPTTNIGNTYFTGTITGATNGANANGTVNDFFTASGQDYSVSQAGAFSAPVPYTYANTGANTGTITESGVVVTLTFTSPTGGTFAAAYSGGGTQAGTFTTNTAGYAAPLSDVSTLTTIDAGGTATTGFYVSGGVPRSVLVRAVGPGLAGFGVKGTLAAPTLQLWNGTSTTVIATGSSPTAASVSVMSAVGAFALTAGGKDSAIIMTLAPGGYTAQVKGGTASDSGLVLLEVYYLN
jgi:hypothetical protein